MKQKLYELVVPKHIKNKLYHMNVRRYQMEEIRKRELIEEEHPPIELSPIYIQELQVVVNLNELLKRMPKNVAVAEVGVGDGVLSGRILAICHPSKIFLIDNWSGAYPQVGLIKIIRNKFKEEIQSGVVELFDGDPIAELEKIPNGTLDWIYLRSDNTYQKTVKLLEVSCRKVKNSGLILGCNYAIGHWLSMQRYGVIESVNEFCMVHGWELIYLTNESDRFLSYALAKMKINLDLPRNETISV